MQREEFVIWHREVLDKLWPHNRDRPVPVDNDPDHPSTQAYVAYMRARYPAMSHIPVEHALHAAYALARSRDSKYEPPLSEFVRYAERSMGLAPASGTALSWPDAQQLMNEALRAHSEAGHQVRPHHVRELENGNVEVIPDMAWKPAWEVAAGPVVGRFIRETGGILVVARRWPDTTYVAQFRMWIEALNDTDDVESDLRMARHSLAALAEKPPPMLSDSIAALIDQLPFRLDPPGDRRALGTGREGDHLDAQAN
jgi:hypothetical protein